MSSWESGYTVHPTGHRGAMARGLPGYPKGNLILEVFLVSYKQS